LEVLKEIYVGILNTTLIEGVAVLVGITYLILIASKNRWGWWLAFISSLLYVYLTYSVDLYVESFLQVFYVGMAVYGWMVWNKPENKSNRVKTWNAKIHVVVIITGSILSVLIGFLLQLYTNQANPYLDTFTTIFSLAATFMAAHKLIENWIYWIIIDTGLIFLYMGEGLYLIGMNYLIYTIIAIFAFVSWYKSFKTQKN